MQILDFLMHSHPTIHAMLKYNPGGLYSVEITTGDPEKKYGLSEFIKSLSPNSVGLIDEYNTSIKEYKKIFNPIDKCILYLRIFARRIQMLFGKNFGSINPDFTINKSSLTKKIEQKNVELEKALDLWVQEGITESKNRTGDIFITPSQNAGRRDETVEASFDKEDRIPDETMKLAKSRILEAFTEGKECLDLRGLGLTTIPSCISMLQSLKKLFLDDNQLESLPKELGELGALRELWVTGNQLYVFPQWIDKLKQLEILALSGSDQIEFISPKIGKLTALKKLFMRGNGLVSIPEEIGKLKQLEILDLADNYLDPLPEEIIDELTALQYLFYP